VVSWWFLKSSTHQYISIKHEQNFSTHTNLVRKNKSQKSSTQIMESSTQIRFSLKFITDRKISINWPGGIHFLSTHNFWIIHKRTKIKNTFWKSENFSIRTCFYLCSMTSGSEVMCRKKVDTPWSIYRVFTVPIIYFIIPIMIHRTP